MKNFPIIAVWLLISAYAFGETCLNEDMIGKPVRTITGVGLTYQDARQDLYKKMPQVGVLQSISTKTVKTSSLNAYQESSVLSQTLNATFDHVMVHNCKLQDGRYASSVAFPKDGVTYLHKPNSNIFDEPVFKKEFATFKYAAKSCGHEIYTILITMNRTYQISKGRVVYEKNNGGIHTVIICGQFTVKSDWFNHGSSTDVREIFANRYNLIYFGHYRNKHIKDYSQELGLELIKNAM